MILENRADFSKTLQILENHAENQDEFLLTRGRVRANMLYVWIIVLVGNEGGKVGPLDGRNHRCSIYQWKDDAWKGVGNNILLPFDMVQIGGVFADAKVRLEKIL